jgi:hypothetical protein
LFLHDIPADVDPFNKEIGDVMLSFAKKKRSMLTPLLIEAAHKNGAC